MAAINSANNANPRQPRERKLILSNLFTDAPIRKEEREVSKVVVAGLQEAQVVKEYPDTFFGRAFAVLRGEMSLLIKSAFIFTLFTIPFIVILAWFAGYFEQLMLGGDYNFMGNIGVGFPGGGDSINVSVAELMWKVKTPVIAMLGACLVIGSFGLAGSFYCAKRSYFQNYYKHPIKMYFKGFAKYWYKYVLTSFVTIIIGLGMVVALMNLLTLQTLGSADAGAYCAVVFSWIVGLPLLPIPVIMMGLYVSYELTFVQTLKNAIVIYFNQPVIVVLTCAISAAPLALCAVGGSFLPIIICIAMALIGQTLMSLCWIAMADRGMVKCHNRKRITDKHNVQEMRKAQKAQLKASGQPAPQKKKPQNTPYQNPKKKKKK